MKCRDKSRLAVFLLVETLIYLAVIFPGFHGIVNHPLRYAAILVCAACSVLLFWEKRDRNHLWLSAALVLTALADFYFEILTDRVLEPLFIFAFVQWCHGIRLMCCLPRPWKEERSWFFFIAVRILGPGGLAAIMLKSMSGGIAGPPGMTMEERLALALMLVYGINILLNLGAALTGWFRRKSRFFSIVSLAFVLFICCDITVAANLLYPHIGLSAEAAEALARLTWVFYIPSQVLFMVSGILCDYSGK